MIKLSIFGSGIAVVKQKSAKFRQSLLAALRLLDKKNAEMQALLAAALRLSYRHLSVKALRSCGRVTRRG